MKEFLRCDREDHHARVKLETALEVVAEYAEGDRLEGLKRHIDPIWIEEALEWSGTVTLRRRRLPAEQVLWLVIGMGLMRAADREHGRALELALPDTQGTLDREERDQPGAHSGSATIRWLTCSRSAPRSGRRAAPTRIGGELLALYGMDGTTMRVLIRQRIARRSAASRPAAIAARADIRKCVSSR